VKEAKIKKEEEQFLSLEYNFKVDIGEMIYVSGLQPFFSRVPLRTFPIQHVPPKVD